MDMTLAIVLLFLAILSLSIASISIALLMLFRRCRIPCCNDLELGHSNPKVADIPDPETEPSKDVVLQLNFNSSEIDSLLKSTSTSIIGQGGFSTVYLANLPNSSLAALKLISHHRLFSQELDILLHLNHPNIVRLLGHCDRGEDSVLVVEYVANGTLDDILHRDSTLALPWFRRMSIAFQLATALEYLHELQIVHGDIKASNILLDQDLNMKLCDFGSARMGFSAAIQPKSAHTIMGSVGYMDPYYLRTGLISKKNDVYSFGVVLMELITGLEAFCSENGKMLSKEIGAIVKDDMKEFVDGSLCGEYDKEEVAVMAGVAAQCCLRDQPSLRPSMSEIVRIMRQKMPSAGIDVMLTC